MDRFSAVAPACVRVLLLPVGQIERHTYLDVVRQLQLHAVVIPLKALETQSLEDDLLLSPQHFSGGSILFNYAVAEVPEPQRQLAPFELFRETLLVLGITAGLSKDPDQYETQLKRAAEELRERHGRVVHRHLLLLDDAPSPTQVQHVTVLQATNQHGLSLAMQQVAARFLHELSTYAKAMQASPSIQTPGQISQGMLRSMMLREDEGRPPSRHSALGDPKSPTSEDNSSRPPSLSQDILPPATSFDQMPAANALGRSDSNTSRRSKSRPRTTSFDRVPVLSKEKTKDRGKARVGIVIGSIYLMSGQWAEALKILVDNTTRSRALNDHIWNGKGLEMIVVCLLLHLWAGIDVQVPAICYQLSDRVRDRFSKAFAAELAQKISGPQTAAEKLSSSLPDLMKHILLLYHSIEGTMELPYITVAEATVRASRTLACLQATNGMLDQDSIPHIVKHESPLSRPKWSSSTFQVQKPLSKTGISDLVTHALPSTDENIPLSDHISILTGVASVYSILQMDRKRAITMKTLIARLTSALYQARKLGAAEMGIHPAASLSLDSDAGALADMSQSSSGLIPLARDLVSVYGMHLEYDDTTLHTNHRQFGSATLQLEILRDLLKLCEASPDLKGISLMVVAMMSSAGHHGSFDLSAKHRAILISAEEQSKLISMQSRANGISKQAGIELAEYNYWDPFLLRGIELHPLPQERAIYEATAGLSVSPSNSAKNPLLYDPNARKTATKEDRIVLPLGEASKFSLTLQNPFDVAIDIESLDLVIEGTALAGSCENVRLGPARLEHIVIEVKPQTVGDTAVTGCRIKVAGCLEQMFLLTRAPWTSIDTSLLKSIGQDGLQEEILTESSAPDHDRVAVTVIDRQPQLLLRETSSQIVMLLEGEKQRYSIVLENVSDVPAVIKSVQCHTDGIKLANEQHKAGSLTIEPQQSYKQEFDLIGQLAASVARASIAYASSANSKFTRMVEVALELTIKPAISVSQVDIVPREHDSLTFILDLHNAWSMPCDYTCWTESKQDSNTEGLLNPGQSTKIQLKTLRWLDRSKMSVDLAVAKEELSKHLHVGWHSMGRSGNVSLDGIHLSEDVLRVLAGPAIAITLTHLHSETAQHNEASAGEFTTIRATLKNTMHTLDPVVLQLQCQRPHPSASIDRHALVAGSLSRLIPVWPPDGTVSVDFAICPLSIGAIALDAAVRPALSSGSPINSTTTQSLVMHITE
ncbi:hypothetical protein AMS68_007942 [Peltaster fructicola]|uniref:Hypercellular protein HypA n=1 Tax=Peltaster fructicola TaxID=286661 RepID=A0A6H0Y6A0_9PEZI|nr:hypothetical protein AMS68_007942 [Peltaster fructicola]